LDPLKLLNFSPFCIQKIHINVDVLILENLSANSMNN